MSISSHIGGNIEGIRSLVATPPRETQGRWQPTPGQSVYCNLCGTEVTQDRKFWSPVMRKMVYVCNDH